jgi:hypothetical protein
MQAEEEGLVTSPFRTGAFVPVVVFACVLSADMGTTSLGCLHSTLILCLSIWTPCKALLLHKVWKLWASQYWFF